jgi:hypothetical protein
MAISILIVATGAASATLQPGFADDSVAAVAARGACKPVACLKADASATGQLAQGECPPDYPVDCYDGSCCPADTSCCDDGSCCPTGYPHHCGSRCYATLQDAIDAGCSMAQISVCGVAQ